MPSLLRAQAATALRHIRRGVNVSDHNEGVEVGSLRFEVSVETEKKFWDERARIRDLLDGVPQDVGPEQG
jgi:hypothetical protein